MAVRKLSISVPPEVEETITAAAAEEGTPVSTWLAEAATDKAQAAAHHAAGRATARELVADYESEHGPLPAASRQRAREFLVETGLISDSPQRLDRAHYARERRSGERRADMYRVDITADLSDEDDSGYAWTFLDEARDPGQIKPGAIIVAGDEDTAAVCEVVDLAPAGDGIIVHLRLLPGLVEDYQALVERALAG